MYNKKFILLILFYFPLNLSALPNEDLFKYICLLSKDSPAIQASMLQSAIEHQTEYVVKNWLKELPGCTNVSPLLYSIEHGANISIVAMILKYIALLRLDFYNIYNSKGLSIISIATINKDIALVKLLLKNKVPLTWDRNGFKTSALHTAAKYNYLEILKVLINYIINSSLNVHSCDANNFTPISYLICNNHITYALSLLCKLPPSYTIAYLGKNSYYNLAKHKKSNIIIEALDNLFNL